ncbi:hypothetical protein E6W39_01220 [Kitasatospora acidiphila]|uniref:Uncharacterized protein n=1 Tax=Kitasatospora acidiphila TaxID=2567942 RepID=A0A540WG16_9ACTN|nr:hypothetical protein [Kitasatospora acidiphila]TQF07973.1 hypothetical protein E6W39_01220 [Kitasatospora acidiphila]
MEPEYTWWGEVPHHYATRTRLAALDLPRQAAGPVRATITTRSATSRKDTLELSDVREPVPTTATAAQLAAAATRRTSTHTCQDCDARPKPRVSQPPTTGCCAAPAPTSTACAPAGRTPPSAPRPSPPAPPSSWPSKT